MTPVRTGSLVIGCLIALVGGCSERSDLGSGPDDSGEVREVTIGNFAFAAPTITIDRGTTVRWRNTTSTFHTVTPDGHQAFAERQTNSPGQSFNVKFDTPGTYKYFCAPHRSLGMTGEIIVR